jgi:hypothetical protein
MTRTSKVFFPHQRFRISSDFFPLKYPYIFKYIKYIRYIAACLAFQTLTEKNCELRDQSLNFGASINSPSIHPPLQKLHTSIESKYENTGLADFGRVPSSPIDLCARWRKRRPGAPSLGRLREGYHRYHRLAPGLEAYSMCHG